MPKATMNSTTRAGRPRNSSTYPLANQRYGPIEDSFIMAMSRPTLRPKTKASAV